MSRNVLIIVDGGRIQDILCDDPDVRVLVKNYDDAPDDVAIGCWPITFVATAKINGLIETNHT